MKVREVIKLIEADGWFLVATRGSHRQFKHPRTRPGDSRGKVIGRFGAWHVEQHFETGRLKGPTLMRYAVVIEKAEGNYSAYVPDLPGCIATGDTVAAVEQEIREAIRFHIDGLKADGLPIPAPTSIAEYIEA
jgi:predicted RNase H-like HicB family nuclease